MLTNKQFWEQVQVFINRKKAKKLLLMIKSYLPHFPHFPVVAFLLMLTIKQFSEQVDDLLLNRKKSRKKSLETPDADSDDDDIEM